MEEQEKKSQRKPTQEELAEALQALNDKEKVVEYEMQIEDMLHVLQERLEELEGVEEQTEFDLGRQAAYLEMMDIIKTRHQIILDVLSDAGRS